MTHEFYDRIAALYHLVYADWQGSIERQAEVLDALLREALGPGPLRVLDVACGIGTQTIGLAAHGHRLTASDVSPGAVARARRELAARGLDAAVSVADMRSCTGHPRGAFDAVISADNAVPHLLDDDEILAAFRTLYDCLRPGGVLLISVRDYDRQDRTSPQMHPYGVRELADGQCAVFQVWRFDGDRYDVAMYFVEERAGREPEVTVARSRYYAVTIPKLIALLERAGFVEVVRIDGRFFQPILRGRRPPAA